jgi:hypothetical protein
LHTDAVDGGSDGIPDVPATQIIAVITAGEDQTLQACYIVPLGFDALLLNWCKSNASQGAAGTAVTFRWRKTESGGTSRNQSMISLGDETTICNDESPPIRFPEKTKIEVTGSDATNQAAAAKFGLILVSNSL